MFYSEIIVIPESDYCHYVIKLQPLAKHCAVFEGEISLHDNQHDMYFGLYTGKAIKPLPCRRTQVAQCVRQLQGQGGSMRQVVGLPNNSYKTITNTAWVRDRLCKLQKGCTRLEATRDKAQQLLVHGRWFSPGTPASSTTKTGRHDIAAILLKVALKH